MTCIENRTIDESAIDDSARLARTISRRDIERFAAMSGDVNPAPMDDEFARRGIFHKIIAHGMWGGAPISAPPGTIYPGQTLRSRRPIGLGDTAAVL